MSSAVGDAGRRRSRRGRRLLLQLALVVAFFCGLEGLLRIAGVGREASLADPFLSLTSEPLFVPDADDPAWLVTAPAHRNHFNLQRFGATKPAGTFRIVCLGGSTTYGRPYADSTSFAGWLRELLPRIDPGRPYEVVNAGGVSYASYRVAAVLEEVLAYEPDLLVVYTGHNEFLEERSYAARGAAGWLPEWITTSALFGLARSVVGAGADVARFELGAEVQTLLDGSLGPDAYERDDALADQVVEHLAHNLARMARAASAASVPLVLVTPASQLKDCRPFKSEPSTDVAAAALRQVAETLSACGEQPAPAADCLPRLEQAVRLDPRQALAWYGLGEARLAAGRVEAARAAFVTARDEDIVPLRATSAIVATVRAVAARQDVYLVDAVELVARLAAERGGVPIPGAELFLDHVHLTIEGYRELALAILDVLVEERLVQPTAPLDAAMIEAVRQRVEGQLDVEDKVRALVRLANVLDWAGKRVEAERLNARALQLSGGGDAMSHWMAGNHARDRGELDGAVASYRAALAIDPGYAEAHHNLTATLLALDRPAEALPHAEEASRLLPERAGTWLLHGSVLDRLGHRTAAREALARARDLAPQDADVHNALGLSYVADRQLEAAERAFRDGIRAEPDSVRSHFNLGIVLLATGRPGEAEEVLRAAVRLDPDHGPAHSRLGDAFLRQGLRAEAIAAYRRAQALGTDDERTRSGLARARGQGPNPPDG